jgi:O-antigen/teichoic acid export membrane protein
MNFSDRFYIERFIDLGNVGVYSLLFMICSLSDLVVFSIGSGVQPYLFEYFKENNKSKINTVYKLWVSITMIAISAIIVLGSHLNLIIDKKAYMEIPSYLPIMILGFIFSAFAYLLNLQITYAKKSIYFFKSNLILVLLNFVSCYFFVSRFGIWGAVISSLLTKFAFNLISVYYVNKIFSTKVNRNLVLFIITIITVIVFFWLLAFYKILSFSTASIVQFFICIIIVGKVAYPYFREFLFKKSNNLLIDKE